MDSMNLAAKLAAENSGSFRTADALKAGLSKTTLFNLVKKGKLKVRPWPVHPAGGFP